LILSDIAAQLAAAYPAVSGVVAYLVAHPTEAAVADLAVANVLDWIAGMTLAALQPTFNPFRRNRIPDFMKKWLPADVPAVYAAIGAAVLASVVQQGNVADAALLAAAGAAAVYSLPTWGDLNAKRQAILTNVLTRLVAAYGTA
jgi:hypothetical protein